MHQSNLAAVSTGRDIANLGLIFRVVFCAGPRQLRSLFSLCIIFTCSSPRRPLHRYQVIDETCGIGRDYLDRYTFGYVVVFIFLPERVFHHDEQDLPISVSAFQSNLNCLLKLSNHELGGWDGLFRLDPLFITMLCAISVRLVTLMLS